MGEKPPGDERRYSRRKAANLPVSFRVLHFGKQISDMQLSGIAEARIRDLGPDGIGLETSQIIIDGLHVAQVTAAHRRPRVFLQCTFPDGRKIHAAAETIWCEQVSRDGRSFQIGLHFRELSDADQQALSAFLHSQDSR